MPELFGSAYILPAVIVVVLLIVILVALRLRGSGGRQAHSRTPSKPPTKAGGAAPSAQTPRQPPTIEMAPPETAELDSPARELTIPAGEPSANAAPAAVRPAVPVGPAVPGTIGDSSLASPLETVIVDILRGWGDLSSDDLRRLGVFRPGKVAAALRSIQLPKDVKDTQHARTRLLQLRSYVASLESEGKPAVTDANLEPVAVSPDASEMSPVGLVSDASQSAGVPQQLGVQPEETFKPTVSPMSDETAATEESPEPEEAPTLDEAATKDAGALPSEGLQLPAEPQTETQTKPQTDAPAEPPVPCAAPDDSAPDLGRERAAESDLPTEAFWSSEEDSLWREGALEMTSTADQPANVDEPTTADEPPFTALEARSEEWPAEREGETPWESPGEAESVPLMQVIGDSAPASAQEATSETVEMPPTRATETTNWLEQLSGWEITEAPTFEEGPSDSFSSLRRTVKTADDLMSLPAEERAEMAVFLEAPEIAKVFDATSDPGLKKALIDMLEHVSTPASLEVLRRCLDDPDPQVQLYALEAADRILGAD